MAHPAQSARIEKEAHPERYCTHYPCLWKTARPNRDGSGGYTLNANPCQRHEQAGTTCGQSTLGPDDSIKPCILQSNHTGQRCDSGVR